MSSSEPIVLKPRAMVEADLIRSDAARLLEYVQARDCIAMAAVVVHADGTCSVQKRGATCRTLLLGAVTDLQYTIASEGD